MKRLSTENVLTSLNVGSRLGRGQTGRIWTRFKGLASIGVAALAVVLAVPALAVPAAGSGRPPRIETPQPAIDLGIVIRGETHTARFPVRNAGEQTLVLKDAVPGCKCTVTEFDREIAPGQTGHVIATIDSHTLWGQVSRWITLTTNDPQTPATRLRIDAIVVGSVELLPIERLQLTNREPDLASGLLLIRQDSTERGTLAITDVRSSVPWLEARVTRLSQLRPAGDGLPTGRAGDYLLEVRIVGQPPSGRSEAEVRFVTGLPREPEVAVPVAVQFQPAVQLSSNEVVLDGEDEKTVLVGMRAGVEPGTLRARTEGDGLTAELERSGERHYKLHVRWSGRPGAGKVFLTLGDETYPIPVTKR